MPILLPLATALLGGFVGFLAMSSYRRRKGRGPLGVVTLLLVVAVAAAAIPNIGQQLFDLGFAFLTIEAVDGVSYLVFGFAAAGAWALLEPSPARWGLLALLPISFAQPMLWTYAHVVWILHGFAP